jgi:actin related protein 2/3 complex subunit 2
LKRNCLAAPFEKAFTDYDNKVNVGPLMTIPYREKEVIYVQSYHDRVVVIFSTVFKDYTDIVFGKIFLQEFVETRRQLGLQNAPQVLFNKELPGELKNIGIKENDQVGYVSFGKIKICE